MLGACIAICGLVLAVRAGANSRSMGQDEIRRIRHFADRVRREEAQPYE